MRSFNSNFNTERAKRGCAPINLMKWDFSTPKYVSDRDVTPSGGSAHSGLVKEWGFVDSSLRQASGTGILDSLEVPDLVVTLINTESTPFSDNFTAADPPENVTVTLYQWFSGLTDADKEIIFKGIVSEVEHYDLYECRVRIAGIWTKYDKMIGEDLVISADEYSSADPDDIGKMRNVCYGDLSNVLCRAIKAGVLDTLRDDLTDSATSFYVSLSGKANFPSGTVTVQIDDEQIQGTYNQSTGQFTSCTRGYNSTTATGHSAGAAVAQVLTEYVYEAASHPVKSIGDVRVDDLKQTSGFTAYTGQTGDELTGYEDTAVIKFTVLPKITKQVNLDVSDGDHNHDGNDQIVTWYFDTGTAYYGSPLSPQNLADGNINNSCRISPGEKVKLERVAYQSWPGTPTNYRLCVRTGSLNGSAFKIGTSPSSFPISYTSDNTTYRAAWTTFTSDWDTFVGQVLYCTCVGSNSLYACEVWYEFQVDNDSADSGAIVSLSGNSTAETVIGKQVTCDLEGYQDDGSGTYTGTANSLIERPDHVFKHFLVEQLSFPSGDIDSTTFTAAGTFFNTNSYALAFLVNRKITAEAQLMKLALQCRSRFMVTAYGKAKLIVRQLSQSSGHAIAKNEIKTDSVRMRRNRVEDLINYFNIYYDKDHGEEKYDAGAYASVKNFSDATSISRYGQREWKGGQDVFLFDAVTDATMIAHVGAFLLDYHELVRKMPAFSVFLDNMEIEPGDYIGVTHDLDSMSGFVCEVAKVMHMLGSAKKNMIDYLQVEAAEN